MKSHIRTILWMIAAGTWLQTDAQSTADLQNKYPGEQAVMLDHAVHYMITVHNGQPQVQSKESQRLLYLSVQSGANLSEYAFYHSGFHEVQRYSAYTLTADSKKIKVTDF